MQANTAIQLLGGFSTGYMYAQSKHKEDEIKQGKNYILSGFVVSNQFALLCNAINVINQVAPPYPGKLAVKVACQLTPILALIASPLCGAVKMGQYEPFAKEYNKVMKKPLMAGHPLSYIHFPEKLSKRTVRLASFLAVHAGNMIRVAMMASAVALIALGNAAYGGALLAAVALEALDSKGFIPRRISLFMEIYLPTVINLGVMLTGVVVAKVISAVTLSTFNPYLNKLLHYKVDDIVRKNVPSITGPTLKQIDAIDAPVVPKKDLTYAEIQKILDDDFFHYNVDPAHYSKWAIDLNKLPHDSNFNKFLSLFDAIDWESKSNYVKKKLKDDDRFMDFLGEMNPGIDKKILSKDFDIYLKKLASKDKVSVDEYAAKWIRRQMIELISMLKGKKRVTGSQQDLDESIQTCKIVLPHLTSLEKQNAEIDDILSKLTVGNKIEIKDPILKIKLADQVKLKDDNGKKMSLENALLKLSAANQGKLKKALQTLKITNQAELEDALLKLAVEGGDYCGRGIKRAANELLWGILESDDLKASQDAILKAKGDPIQSYETKVLQALQNRRCKIVQNAYEDLLNQINVPNAISKDTHGFDIYRMYFSLGFFPLTPYERNNIGLPILGVWEMYHPFRQVMYQQYALELEDVMNEMKQEYHFYTYLEQITKANKLLTDDQKEEILDKYTTCNDGKWSVEEMKERFHRLLFTRLGVHKF